VYVLPDLPSCREDFEWIAQEAVAAGGQASVCRAAFVDDAVADELRTRFRDAAGSRLGPVNEALADHLSRMRQPKQAVPAEPAFANLQRQAEEALQLDFFHSDAGKEVQAVMTAIREHLRPRGRSNDSGASVRQLKGRVWVTRRDPHIDRLATAWLIRRFVDPAAKFRFVDAAGGPVRAGEKSFDMTGADFTHEGDLCSFETMCARLKLNDPALAHLAEIVHDLDLKDGKFGRADALGVQRMVDGLSAAHADSGARVIAAMPIFDTLFASFGGRLPVRKPAAAPVPGRRARR
jgi:hypothetical protein